MNSGGAISTAADAPIGGAMTGDLSGMSLSPLNGMSTSVTQPAASNPLQALNAMGTIQRLAGNSGWQPTNGASMPYRSGASSASSLLPTSAITMPYQLSQGGAQGLLQQIAQLYQNGGRI